jgi:hypothetical protein
MNPNVLLALLKSAIFSEDRNIGIHLGMNQAAMKGSATNE